MKSDLDKPDAGALLPCPFCGGEGAVEQVSMGLGAAMWRASCHNCACTLMLRADAINAIEIWKARQAASHGSAGGEPINDDMIERAIDAHEELFDSGDAVGAMRAALIAALPKLTAAGDDGDEPAMWVCLVDAPENGNKHIRAWTSHRERAERFQADGLEMLPLFLSAAAKRHTSALPSTSLGSGK